ncbi:MAG: hypothetical protein P1V51_17175 [Deltaproteobacteria bacterium]|nr:hypothetical protein [Deltaproteobacteria bacterium]
MQTARRWEVAPVAILTAILAAWSWREVNLFLTVADAPVAAVDRKPVVLFWGPVLVAVLALGLVAIHAAWKAGDARRVRLVYLVFFLTVVLEALVIPDARPGALVTADKIAQIALEQARIQLLLGGGEPGPLPESPAPLQEGLSAMTRLGYGPHYLVAGEPVEDWKVLRVHPCEAPVLEVGGHPVGTVFYCLAADRMSGSLTVVGSGGVLTGPAAIAIADEGPVVVPLKALIPPEEAN